MRRADEQVLRQPLHRPHMILGHHHPADPPAGHAEILGERVDHIDVIADLQRRDGPVGVMQAMVNLIRDKADPARGRRLDQGSQCRPVQHRAGRIAGRGHDQPAQIQSRQIRRHRLQAVRLPAGDPHRHQIQRLQDLAVRRITRLAQPDPVPAIKQRGERQQKRARRPRGHNDPRRIKLHPIPAPVEPGDPGPQRRQAQRHRIAQGRVQCRRHRGPCPGRRPGSGLADFHMNDMTARSFGGPCRLDHIHHNEGIHLAPS